MNKQDLLDTVEDMHNELCNKISAYVYEQGGRIKIPKSYYQLSEYDYSVEKIYLKELFIKDDKVMIKYQVGEGYEPIEIEEYEDELWKFSFNEFVEIINGMYFNHEYEH